MLYYFEFEVIALMKSSKEIIEIFSYSADEQETFYYLHLYMKRISKKLVVIENDKEKLKKFALAGLFLTYRAFNHTGSNLTTEIENISPESIHFKRLKAFKKYFDIEIVNTEHYLSMINFTKFDFVLMIFRLTNISKKLYSFVIK
jgi:hypothetical protein